MANRQLTETILKQHTNLITNREAGKVIKSAISLSNAERCESLQTQLMKDLPPCIKPAHWTALSEVWEVWNCHSQAWVQGCYIA